MEDDKWLQITNDLCKLKPKMVTISGGGEPLLRRELLIKIMRLLKGSGIGVELITNGTLVTDELAKTIAKCCEHYRVSLHSTTDELDELLRGVHGSVGLSFEGIRKIVEWKKKIGRKTPKIDIAMVLTQFNIGEVEKMVEHVATLNVNMVSLRIVHKCGEKYRPSEKQIKFLGSNLKKFESLAAKHNIDIQYDFLPEDVFETDKGIVVKKVQSKETEKGSIEKYNDGNSGNVLCTLPFRELVIFADGRVGPCCNFIVEYDDFENLDSILDKRIDEIWFGEKLKFLRRCLSDKTQLPEKCKECSLDLKPIDQAYKI